MEEKGKKSYTGYIIIAVAIVLSAIIIPIAWQLGGKLADKEGEPKPSNNVVNNTINTNTNPTTNDTKTIREITADDCLCLKNNVNAYEKLTTDSFVECDEVPYYCVDKDILEHLKDTVFYSYTDANAGADID